MDDADVDYICNAVELLAESGHAFLQVYRFDLATGVWCHEMECGTETPRFGIREALAAPEEPSAGGAADSREEAYARYLAEARAAAAWLRSGRPADGIPIPGLPPDLVHFEVIRFSEASRDTPEE